MASIIFENVYINDNYVLIGKKEKSPRLKKYDYLLNDDYFNEISFELAEVKMQNQVINGLLKKHHLADSNIDYLISGDLLNQISASSYNAKYFNIPFIGVYAACSTFTEELLIASCFIDRKLANNIICTVSSHNLSAERQFRFPIEYGATRPQISTFTATGCVSALVSSAPSKIKITKGTFGKVIDRGIKDVNYMGAVMAPACANTLYNHLKYFNEKPSDYDLILTGDLGCVGLEILKKYYKEIFNTELFNVMDAGCEIYADEPDTFSGGSGPCCLPIVLFSKIVHLKRYKKILLLGSGSLHNATFVNQKQSIPSICHAVSIEVIS